MLVFNFLSEIPPINALVLNVCETEKVHFLLHMEAWILCYTYVIIWNMC